MGKIKPKRAKRVLRGPCDGLIGIPGEVGIESGIKRVMVDLAFDQRSVD
ncbi:MAG: hypothetical protein HC834_01010 [Rhodospirillales bacterium]|nr:hypothetical protein [Rhodospirillales bacterium]